MDLIRTTSAGPGLVLELERRPAGFGVALFDIERQDWRRIYPTERRALAEARFALLRLFPSTHAS